jgi:transcriptional antiterminator NusG
MFSWSAIDEPAAWVAGVFQGDPGVIDESNNSTEEPRADANGAAPAEDVAPAVEAHVPAVESHSPVVESHASSHEPEATDAPSETAEAPAEEAPAEPAEVAAAAKPAPSKPKPPKPEPVDEPPDPSLYGPVLTGQRDWYILKVQSNREDSIREALQRRINMAGLQDFFGDIIVPTEMVSEFKNGKKRVVKRKLYPGYLVCHMELNEDTWFLVRETHGIGDFTGSGGKPSPMLPHEVSRIVSKQEDTTDEAPKLKINFHSGDRVKITEGTFENFEGDVDTIDEANGRVTVMINIFGRSTPVELEYWQVESV